MAKYIMSCANSAETQYYLNWGQLSKPYVVYQEDTQQIDFNSLSAQTPTPYFTQYLTMTSQNNFSFNLNTMNGSGRNVSYEYSVDGGNWTTIQYGNTISYTAKGNSKYYYVNKTTGGYGDSGYSTTYTPTSSILPADGGATSATAVAFTYNVGSCTAYKAYTIKTTVISCDAYTYVKSAHALGETSFTSKSNAGSSYTVYETDVFYSNGTVRTSGDLKITTHTCTNNGVSVSPSTYEYLTVGGSGSNTHWAVTTSSTASTGIKYRVYFGTVSSPHTVNGNVFISYEAAGLIYTYYPYNSTIYSSKINSGTTFVNIYDPSKVSTAPPRLAYYPAKAIRITGSICLQKDDNNTQFSHHLLTKEKIANLKHIGFSGTASMGNQGPASGNSGTAQRQYLSVSKKAGAYKFYIKIWGIAIPS